MTCERCGSDRMADISAKCSDMFSATIGDKEHQGYVPDDMNVGGGDYVDITYCLVCGQMEGVWPLAETELEGDDSDVDD